MAGTRRGGIKSAKKVKEYFGEDWYRVQGAKGGKAPTKNRTAQGKNLKGFALNPERARIAGQKGGRNGSRKGIPNKSRKAEQ